MKRLNKLECLSLGKPFQPYLIFVSKDSLSVTKKFYNIDAWYHCHKTFFSVTDEEDKYAGASVTWQAFSALSNIC